MSHIKNSLWDLPKSLVGEDRKYTPTFEVEETATEGNRETAAPAEDTKIEPDMVHTSGFSNFHHSDNLKGRRPDPSSLETASAASTTLQKLLACATSLVGAK